MVNGVSVDIRPRSANKGAGASARSTAPVAADRINSAKVSLKDSAKLSQPQLPEPYLVYKENKAGMSHNVWAASLGAAGIAAFSITLTVLTGVAGPLILGIPVGAIMGFVAVVTHKEDLSYKILCDDLGNLSIKDFKETIAQIRTEDPKLADRLTADFKYKPEGSFPKKSITAKRIRFNLFGGISDVK